jgi:hypothetical protein
MVSICVALAQGLMIPWVPVEQVKTYEIPNIGLELINSNDKNRKSSATPKKTTTAVSTTVQTKAFTLPQEAMSDLKKALEVSLF